MPKASQTWYILYAKSALSLLSEAASLAAAWTPSSPRSSFRALGASAVKAYGPEAREEDLMAGADSEEEGGSASEAESEAEEEEEMEQEAAGL